MVQRGVRGPQPLRGLRVLEVEGSTLAASLVGRHLADLGASVRCVPARSVPPSDDARVLACLRRGKESPSDAYEEGHAWDVVVDGSGEGEAAVCAQTRVYVRLDGDPDDDVHEQVSLARAGVHRGSLNLQLQGVDGGAYMPFAIASAYASVHAALAAVALLLGGPDEDARRGEGGGEGRGTTARVDVRLADAVRDTLVHNSLRFDKPSRYVCERAKALPSRAPPRALRDVSALREPFYAHYRCGDGRWLYLVAPAHLGHQQRVVDALGVREAVEAMGVPVARPYDDGERGGPEHGMGAGQVGREHRPRLMALFAKRFLAHSAEEWEARLAQAGVPCAAHLSTREWCDSEHVREAGLVEVDEEEDDDGDGDRGKALRPCAIAWAEEGEGGRRPPDDADADAPPSRLPVDSVWPLRCREEEAKEAEGDGGAPQMRQPLRGVRVLDLSNVIAGPTIGAMLARFGADVVRVDPPTPTYAPEVTGVYGLPCNAGKRSVLLDARPGSGDRPAVERLVRAAA